MDSRDNRRGRRSDRPRRQAGRLAVEGLETRQLLAYSPFGYSLPELSVTGYAAPQAAWGGTLAIDVTVENQGASSLIEPLDNVPGSTNNTLNTPAGESTNSTADSTPTTVQVFASTRPNANSGLVKIDTIAIPGITQNSSYEALSVIQLPSRPAGFPAHGKLFLTLVVNNDQSILQISNALNVYRVPNPVHLTAALPDLQVVNFDVPTPLQPGDVITPTIEIANLGAADTALQGPVTVDLVASLNKTFGPGDSVLASYKITDLPGADGVPTQAASIADTADNLLPLPNVNVTTLSPIKLPTSPGQYYIGVVIDPTSSINQTYAPNPAIRAVTQVGPADPFLAPATLVVNTGGVVPVFPALPSSVIGPAATTTTSPDLFPVTTTPVRPILRSSSASKKSK